MIAIALKTRLVFKDVGSPIQQTTVRRSIVQASQVSMEGGDKTSRDAKCR